MRSSSVLPSIAWLPRLALFGSILLLPSCNDSSDEILAEVRELRKELDETKVLVETLQRNQRNRNEGEAERNMRSYFR